MRKRSKNNSCTSLKKRPTSLPFLKLLLVASRCIKIIVKHCTNLNKTRLDLKSFEHIF